MEKEKIVLNLENEGECLTFYGEPDFSAPGVEFECVLAPGSKGPEPHIHTAQTETFHVVSGVMIARLKGQDEITLGPGETITVPEKIEHSFSNGSADEPLVTRIVVEPALDFQWFLSEAAKSAIRNGGNWKDMPLLEAGRLMWLSRDQQRVGGMPYVVQDILFGAISLLAMLTGRAKNIGPKPRRV
ncbi:MAG: cupin domain-containing protein [Balneolaceae bacterium]|nr:cupin domain-containing protein [Balneolaceae bacterium]